MMRKDSRDLSDTYRSRAIVRVSCRARIPCPVFLFIALSAAAQQILCPQQFAHRYSSERLRNVTKVLLKEIETWLARNTSLTLDCNFRAGFHRHPCPYPCVDEAGE